MAYVPVPKDLSKIKTKVAFNLTKRQIICFAAALAMGLPLFFLLKDSAGTSMAAFAMIVVMLPCFLLAMYEKHGQPLEVVIKNVIQTKFMPTYPEVLVPQQTHDTPAMGTLPVPAIPALPDTASVSTNGVATAATVDDNLTQI